MGGSFLDRQDRNQRHRPHAYDNGFAGDPARNRGLRQNELRLPHPCQLDIHLGKQFGVEQRAVLGAAGIIYAVTRAKIIQPV